jgi:hypothetical protein
MNFQEFTSFNKMITPTIIKIIFWIGVVGSVLFGVIQIGSGIASPYGGGLLVFSGLVLIIVGPLVTRVYCELLILLFKMHESLQNISNRLDSKNNEE